MATILVVDDSKTLRDLMARVVQSEGHICLQAEDGVEAVDMAGKSPPDLILMDVVMPKQDGFQTLRKLRKEASTKDVPVVLVTSKGTDSDKFWGKKQGANAHIVKPFTEEQLAQAIRKFI